MNEAIEETNRRAPSNLLTTRKITSRRCPSSRASTWSSPIVEADYVTVALNEPELDAAAANVRNEEQLAELLKKLETQMRDAAKNFEFEKAAQLRDRIRGLKQRDLSGVFSKDVQSAEAAS